MYSHPAAGRDLASALDVLGPLYVAFTLSPQPDLPGTVRLPHVLCAVEQYLPVTVRDHSE